MTRPFRLNRGAARLWAGLLLGGSSPQLWAHSFGRSYTPPLPFWMYVGGAALALLASFLVVSYFLVRRAEPARAAAWRGIGWSPGGIAWVLPAARLLALASLLLCVATGLLGKNLPYGNFNMTFFWIWFVLGLPYLTVLVGDVYAFCNPWRSVSLALGRVLRGYPRGLLSYPRELGYWPALVLYMSFIWIELYARNTPLSLAWGLLGYSLLNGLGVGLIGLRDWFRYCEFFSVMLRLLGAMAPLAYMPRSHGQPRQVCLRWPGQGLLELSVQSWGLVVFVLFMLASTSFDGLQATLFWRELLWVDLYQAGLRDWVGRNPLAAVPSMIRINTAWNTLGLILSPFVYLGAYLSVMALARRLTGGRHTLRHLAFQFAPSLLPIALVYHLSHYYTLIQSQGVRIVALASDPFGWGWNVFGTAKWLQRAIIPDANTVWHVQLVLIVAGHVASVVLAHLIALRLFPGHRQAVVSQLAMLVLMMALTSLGLWILAQPLVIDN